MPSTYSIISRSIQKVETRRFRQTKITSRVGLRFEAVFRRAITCRPGHYLTAPNHNI